MEQEHLQPLTTEEENSVDQDTTDTQDDGQQEEQQPWQELLLQEVSALRKDIESLHLPKDTKIAEDSLEKEQETDQLDTASSSDKYIFDQVIEKEQKFAQQNPDYSQATLFLRQKRGKDLELQGIEDSVERERIIDEEALNFAKDALKRGEDPAAKVYTIAKAWGYIKPDESKPNQHQAASLSLGNLPGNGQSSLSPESLMAMDDEDFSQYWQKVMR